MSASAFKHLREKKRYKILAAFLAVNILSQIISPSVSYALTSGPAQEEFASFEPASTSDMVDLYSGDFTYNIPLLSVPGPNGGYPINLAYHSGVGMEQEASWVGLGWNINVGAINRQLRGLPDDFKKETIEHRMHLKPNTTVSLTLPDGNIEREWFGFGYSDPSDPGIPVAQQVYYNTYKGLGHRVMLDLSKEMKVLPISVGLGLSYDSQNGIGLEPRLSLGNQFTHLNHAISASASINSRQGLQSFSFTVNRAIEDKDDAIKTKHSSTLSFSMGQSVPGVSIPMRTTTLPFDIKITPSLPSPSNPTPYPGHDVNSTGPTLGKTATMDFYKWNASVSDSRVEDGGVSKTNAYGYLYTSEAGDSDMKDFQRDNIPYSKKVPNLAPSSFTYDIYSHTGQGTGGMFRPYQTNVGVLTDARKTDQERSYRVNAEFAAPAYDFDLLKYNDIYHAGLGFSLGVGSTSSGSWEQTGNDPDDNLSSFFKYSNWSGTPDFETVYFQSYGEKTAVLHDENFLRQWGDDEALRPVIEYDEDESWLNRQFVAKNSFVRGATDVSPVTPASGVHQYKNYRERRSTYVQQFTQSEAANYGYSKTVTYKNPSGSTVSKSFTSHPDHLSEINVIQSDGMRYTYGLPAYNNTQYDVSFSTATTGDFNNTVAAVPSGLDVSGIHDEFKNQTLLPSYVHSWLLTSVVSSDYVDRTGNGPTDDDFGYWVKFNYKQTEAGYKWRVPYRDARFSEGNKNVDMDNRGSYTFGTKELYYIESIETKTHIAIFNLTNREDAYSSTEYATGTAFGTEQMKKLDKIQLYTKAEYTANNPATPIKTVHFRYSYKLCPDVENNKGTPVDIDGNSINKLDPGNVNANSGKLTLDELYFTYQNSTRGRLSPYVFNYGNTTKGSSDNPSYSQLNMDRWGNYKANSSNYISLSNLYPYVDFPYTDQKNYSQSSPSYQAPKVDVWTLKEVYTPSGGTLKIQYESDDYAYVEDKHAMQMFDIQGLGESSQNPMFYSSIPGGYVGSDRKSTTAEYAHLESHVKPTSGNGYMTDDKNYRIYFDLEEEIPASYITAHPGTDNEARSQYVKDHIIRDMTKLWFKVYTDLKYTNNNDQKDYVEGYADILTAGHGNVDASGPNNITSNYYGVEADGNGDYLRGYITLKAEPLTELNLFNDQVNPSMIDVHPFMKAAFQHLKANRPELIHPVTPPTGNPISMITALMWNYMNILNDIGPAMGFNLYSKIRGYGQVIELGGRSIIKLHDPDGIKYGGGVRVKQLSLTDNWVNNGTVTTDGFEYGQTYDYSMEENGRTISSGVAYEPAIGAEESALRSPVTYNLSTPIASKQKLFVEKPLMESYYPGQSVGYRKVTVKSIATTKADLDDDNSANSSNVLKHSATPTMIYEYYTPKDFPVIVDETDMNSHNPVTRAVMIPGIYTSFKKRKARSQGYSIVLNDMAGKPRATTQFTQPTAVNPNGTIISRQEFVYHTDPVRPGRLSSKVQVLVSGFDYDTPTNSSGRYQTATIGESADIFIDMHENVQKTKSRGADFNIDMLIPPAPASVGPMVPMLLPNLSDIELSMRTVVMNKIIYRTGILKETIITTDQSVIRTENLAYDLESGAAILTKVTNEFKDPLYNYTYPAHWYYDNLDNSYKNTGVLINYMSATGQPYITTAANGRININQWIPAGKFASDYFIEGDVVWINFSTTYPDALYTVVKVYDNLSDHFIDCIKTDNPSAGTFIPTPADIKSIKVIRSGKRNLQGLAAGSLVAKSITGFVPYDPSNKQATEKTSPTSYSFAETGNIIDASAVEYSDVWETQCVTGCGEYGVVINGTNGQNLVNPYAQGIRGNWRAYKSYKYVTGRNYGNNNRTDGTFSTFNPFYWSDPASRDAKWTLASTVTKYSPYGFELENKDALGRYSAALYEYNNSLVTAVASNSMHKEIAFESFEDYYTYNSCDAELSHWGITPSSSTEFNSILSTQAHTGKYSLKLAADKTVESTIVNNECELQKILDAQAQKAATTSSLYMADDCDCMGQFSPKIGKQYVLSAWTREYAGTSNTPPAYNSLENFTHGSITVSFYSGTTPVGTPVTLTPSGNIIEGWQRIYGTFTIPSGTNKIAVKLSSSDYAGYSVLFDDIRMHPFDGNMKSYVYDRVSLKFMAELDENNFATIYNYDDEGHVSKIKKETVNGIKTLKEGRIQKVIK